MGSQTTHGQPAQAVALSLLLPASAIGEAQQRTVAACICVPLFFRFRFRMSHVGQRSGGAAAMKARALEHQLQTTLIPPPLPRVGRCAAQQGGRFRRSACAGAPAAAPHAALAASEQSPSSLEASLQGMAVQHRVRHISFHFIA